MGGVVHGNENPRGDARLWRCVIVATSLTMPSEGKRNGEPCALNGAFTVRREAQAVLARGRPARTLPRPASRLAGMRVSASAMLRRE
jgi:hypothetical protein